MESLDVNIQRQLIDFGLDFMDSSPAIDEFYINNVGGFTAMQTVNFWKKVITTQSVPRVSYFDPESQDFSMDESCVELANFINAAHRLEDLLLDNQVGDRPI